jgi:hypothetical protein
MNLYIKEMCSMTVNPYTITTGGLLIHEFQRAADEKLNVEDKKKWDDMDTYDKTRFLERGGVTWGQNMPDTSRDQIHIGVFGACRILLHADYINLSLLAHLCQHVSKVALLDPDNIRVIWDTTTLDLQHQLHDAVETLNAAWNSGDVETKITFVENSLTLTNEDIKEQIKILSNLITPDGHNGFMAVRGRLASETRAEYDSEYDEWGNY